MENLFSFEDIATIEKDAAANFETYWDTRVGTGNSTERTIMTISKLNNLIFVKGNEYTGWDHFWDRHAQYSFRNYWKANGEGIFKLDDPGKFHPHMMPIIDYVKIADAIFTEENKNIEKNKRPDLFDVYIGIYTFRQESQKYRLLVYKGSRIVHTLFPDKKKHNPENKTRYAKGPASKGFTFPAGYNDLRIPYLNAKELPAYSILFRKSLGEQIERAMIVVHDAAGEDNEYYILGYRQMDGMEQFEHEDMELLQYSSLSEIEQLINEIDRTGQINSMEIHKKNQSFFEVTTDDEFEVLFELNGARGKAVAKERHSDDMLYFDISNIQLNDDSKVDIDYDRSFSIMPIIILNEGETRWLEYGVEDESDLVTAIGNSILQMHSLH